MKLILSILFAGQVLIASSQSIENQKFQKDLIQGQLMGYDGETRISTEIDSRMMQYHLEKLKAADTRKQRTFVSADQKDSIALSISELDSVIAYFSNPENLRLKTNPTTFPTIDSDSMLAHLQSDHNNQVVIVSSPFYLRQERIAVAFFGNLCCGKINGYVNFSFYRPENSIWKRWIDISSGAF